MKKKYSSGVFHSDLLFIFPAFILYPDSCLLSLFFQALRLNSEYLYFMLAINGVTKKYGTRTVLQIPSLCLNSGLYWVQGVNGSGKTTFMKMIAGLLPFAGDILLHNTSLKKEPVAYRRQVSWSEAEPLFPSFMTGTDLVKLYRSLRRAPASEAEALINLFAMSDYISQPVGTYSAGMTKKLSLLLSFLGRPSLLLLDEPLITLDADAVTVVCKLILQTRKESGTSYLLSSHQDIDPGWLPFDQKFLVQNQTVTSI